MCGVPRAGATGNHGLLGFLYHAFFAGDIAPFRWSYELEQNIRWFLFGPHLALHHLVMWSYRLVTAGLACRLVHEYAARQKWEWSAAACYLPIAYGLFCPIVPESRIGLQEPLFSLLMLAAVNLLLSQMNHAEAGKERDWLFIGTIVLLSGMKEPAVPVAGLLFLFFFALQIRHRRGHWVRNGAILLFLAYSAARVAIVARNDTYSQGQGNLSSFNPGWLFYRMRETFETIVLWRSGLVWLTALCTLFLLAGMVRLLRDFKRPSNRSAALLFLLLFGLLFLLTAKMKLVLRYCEPTIWVAAVVMGVGLAQIRSMWKSPVAELLAALALAAIVAGNYLPFNDQFAFQANAREYENRFLDAVTTRLDGQNADEVLVFGISKDHEWGIRRSEPPVLAKMFLEEYRPIVLAQPAIQGIPVERTEKIHAGSLLIGIVSGKQLREEIPELHVEELAEFKPRASFGVLQFQHGLTEFFRRLHICADNHWIDGGSPQSIAEEASLAYLADHRCPSLTAYPRTGRGEGDRRILLPGHRKISQSPPVIG